MRKSVVEPEDFNDDKKDAGEMAPVIPVTALTEIVLPARRWMVPTWIRSSSRAGKSSAAGSGELLAIAGALQGAGRWGRASSDRVVMISRRR